MRDRNEAAYLELVTAWQDGGSERVCTKIRELFTEETVWVQPGLPTAIGADEAVAIVQTWGQAFSSYELEVRHVASTDDAVLVERFETFRRPDGSVYLELPVVGVAEFRDGKITTWREYYDTAAMANLGDAAAFSA
jgi:limonene-1,2-epoxide hydrolase